MLRLHTSTTGNTMKKTFVLALLVSAYAIWMPAAQAAEGLPLVKDFRIEAKESVRKQVPILVLFMTPSCPYCKRALKDFLLPMQRNPEYESKVMLRQVDYSSNKKLLDFNGKKTTQNKFAKTSNIMAVPTVVFFDSKGLELSRIEGLPSADFYQSYLDNAISESQEKIKAGSR
jgi:thioredoxin-related protein